MCILTLDKYVFIYGKQASNMSLNRYNQNSEYNNNENEKSKTDGESVEEVLSEYSTILQNIYVKFKNSRAWETYKNTINPEVFYKDVITGSRKNVVCPNLLHLKLITNTETGQYLYNANGQVCDQTQIDAVVEKWLKVFKGYDMYVLPTDYILLYPTTGTGESYSNAYLVYVGDTQATFTATAEYFQVYGNLPQLQHQRQMIDCILGRNGIVIGDVCPQNMGRDTYYYYAWTYLWVYLRILNPEKARRVLEIDFLRRLTPKKLKRLIKAFASYLVAEGYVANKSYKYSSLASVPADWGMS